MESKGIPIKEKFTCNKDTTPSSKIMRVEQNTQLSTGEKKGIEHSGKCQSVALISRKASQLMVHVQDIVKQQQIL